MSFTDYQANYTRQQLLENFDDEVREKLKVRDETSKAYLNHFERLLMHLTQHELNGPAEFETDSAFRLTSHPFPELDDKIPLGRYELPRRSGEAHLYRFSHPLAAAVVARAKAHPLPPAEIHFDYGRHDGKVSILEPFIGQSGWLKAWLYTVESLDQAEDHLILAAVTDNERPMDKETVARLLSLPGNFIETISGKQTDCALGAILQERQAVIQKEISEEYKVHGGKMRGSTKMVHFRHAAIRHYNDGELLINNGRQANAGQLYGFAAECGIKWLLVWKGYPTDPTSGELIKKGKKIRVHIHELIKNIHLVHTFLDGRGALKYMAMIPGIGNFSDWKTDHRYYIDSALPPSLLNWQKSAREIMKMLDEALLDGETT